MKNITLAMDEQVIDRARIIAAERKTTVNGMVRAFLTNLVDEEQRLSNARLKLKRLMENSQADLGPDYVWNREEIYADRLLPRHKHPDLRCGGKEE